MAGPESKAERVGAVTVQAFADHEAVSPSETLGLAVSLTMDKGWHVYWQNPGGSTGLPTEVQWQVPGGFSIGRAYYPVPQTKFEKELKETTYVHSGAAVFITPIQVPADLGNQKEIKLTAKVSWLACEKACVPGSAEVSLILPVAAAGSKPKPANEKLFEGAREALPEPVEKAEHVKLVVGADRQEVKPGDKFTATITAELPKGHHMQSNKPLQEELIPAVLFVERTDGLDIGEVQYPKAQEREDKVLGKLSEYSGKIDFKVPVRVEKQADRKGRWIRAVLQYQVCTDAGTCYRPQWIELKIPVLMTGGAKPAGDWTLAENLRHDRPGSEDTGGTPVPQVDGSTAETAAPPEGGSALQRIESWFESFGYIGVLGLAFIGGIILNLMPCVLPVISLKILSYVRQAKEDRARIFLLGLTYCAGVMVFFGFIAVLFGASGTGWGQLFQSPYVVLALAAIVTAFALSLFGVFTVLTPQVISDLGHKAEQREGPLSAFFTGVLATFLGTACTAPFLSAAVGAASKFPPTQGALVFVAVGGGMALPFLLLSANPGWLKFVPKPGPWMEVFERVMGFLLLGTVIWLLNPLRGQLGDWGLLLSMIFLLGVAMAVWIKGMVKFGDSKARWIRLHAVVFVVLVLGWVLPFRLIASIPALVSAQIDRRELLALGDETLSKLRDQAQNPAGAGNPDGGQNNGETGLRVQDWSKGIPWKHYMRSRAMSDVRRGHTVFVDYTADWCVNCKVNKKTSIENTEVIALMKEYNVVVYEADYTLPVPEIKEDLRRFNKAGVPLYLVYSPGSPDNPQVLPEILTPSLVIEAIKRAGPSRASDR